MAELDDDFVEDGRPDPTVPSDPFNPESVAEADAARLAETGEAGQKAVDILRRRQEAYVRVFNGVPMPGDGKIVMDDLAMFCRGGMSAFDENERIHVLLTGRQEVYLRIEDHTRLPFDALQARYTAPPKRDK